MENMSSHESNTHSEAGYADDVHGKSALVIWGLFLVMAALIYASIIGITFWFDYEVEKERYKKIAIVQSKELQKLKVWESAVLGGRIPIVEGSKSISINDAMNRIAGMKR